MINGSNNISSGGTKATSLPTIAWDKDSLMPPPGEGWTNIAAPTKTKLVAKVTTISAIPDLEIIQPVSAPITTPTPINSTAKNKDFTIEVPAM